MVNANEVKEWWAIEGMERDQQIGKASGKLRRFIVEPFVALKQEEEAYLCIYSVRD